MLKYNEMFIECKRVKFYSPHDEDAFFEWINKIKSVTKYDGKLDELYLYIKNKNISNKDLRELIALFYRYNIDMKQLRIFLTKKNKEWFFDPPKGYWYKRVFG
jgi:hypothetical protein